MNSKKIFLISQGLLLKKDIQPIIKKEEVTKNFLFFKEWQSYSAVILDGYTFYNIHHVSNKTQKKITLSHLFWIYAKRGFVIYNGVAKHMYGTFIKNSEYRFNHRYEDLYLLIMRLLKEQGHVLPQD